MLWNVAEMAVLALVRLNLIGEIVHLIDARGCKDLSVQCLVPQLLLELANSPFKLD